MREADASTPWAAAIVDDRTIDMDGFLARIVHEQLAKARRVHGCLMRRPPREAGCATTMVLEDIATGDKYLVSQPMGSGSTACRADPQGFARASQIFRTALTRAPDLVVSNRFGDLEVMGNGFAAELLAVMAQGLPLLTTVATRNVEAWQVFTGAGLLLPSDPVAIADWIDRALSLSEPA
jgi:nucleoside-triphosphatase THEP1